MTGDFSAVDHGTIWLLTPLSAAAAAWCDKHLPEEAPRFGAAYAVEHRYIAAIVEGMFEAGLTLAGEG